jgi:hypothetical protein
VLLKSYEVKSKWDNYKQEVLHEVLSRDERCNGRRGRQQQRTKRGGYGNDERLLSTLMRAQLEEEENVVNLHTNQTVLTLEDDPKQMKTIVEEANLEGRARSRNVSSKQRVARRRAQNLVAMSPKSCLAGANANRAAKNVVIEDATAKANADRMDKLPR